MKKLQINTSKYMMVLGWIMITTLPAIGQSFNINGYITAQVNGEPLAYATLSIGKNHAGTVSNDYGFYSLVVSEGKSRVKVSFVGYEPFQAEIDIYQDTTINFELDLSSINLAEVEIVANTQESSNPLETQRFTMADITRMPLVFGEADIVKGIQLQPGVKTIGEGTSGLFVRGGNMHQNLILMDEIPVYNVGHLLGFVSVFNPDAVRSIQFFKGVQPANYGGRISSVLDTRLNNGNNQQHELSGGVSVFAARMTSQGPAFNDKSSYLVSARKSLIDLFLSPGEAYGFIPGFYDLNAKYGQSLIKGGHVQLGVYHGGDKIRSYDGLDNHWGNTGISLKYQKAISSRLFFSSSLIYSRYRNELTTATEATHFTWSTGVRDFSFKTDFELEVNAELNIEYGLSVTQHAFTPGLSNDPLSSIPTIKANENGLYLQTQWNPSRSLSISGGLRWSSFLNTGEAIWFEKSNSDLQIDTMANAGGVYHFASLPEPRVNILWRIGRNQQLELGYGRNAQYMHVLQNNQLAYTSLETWFPVNPNIEKQIGDMTTVGWSFNLSKTLQFHWAGYYKWMQNQIDYVDHAKLINNPYVDFEVRSGNGKAFGTEIQLQKQTGSLTGYISYNYSRSLLRIDEINNGVWYATAHDIPHDIRLQSNFMTKKRWEFSLIWMYQTGRTYTIPSGYFHVANTTIPTYGSRNSARYPDYHRLDAAAILHPKQNKKFQGTLTLGIYNVYGRQNPLSYNFKMHPGPYIQPSITKYSFVALFPNIAYAFKI